MRDVFSVLKMRHVGALLKRKALKATDEKGLSLLEASLVLALMGVIASVALPYVTAHRSRERLAKTLARQEVILASLANYAITHYALPCPAPNLHQGRPRQKCQEASLAVGFLPYEALGLPKVYAQDGWGQAYIYAVTPVLAHKGGGKEIAQFCRGEKKQFVPSLKVLLTPSQKVSVERTDPLAVVLVSRGAAGRHPQGIGEKINEENSLTFADFPYSTKPGALHRHRVQWWTRNNLLSSYAHFSCPAYLEKKEIRANMEENFSYRE